MQVMPRLLSLHLEKISLSTQIHAIKFLDAFADGAIATDIPENVQELIALWSED